MSDREHIVSVEDLQFTYPGSAEPAVRGISFHVNAGEIFGFLGPSGAGKTTTQRILMKLVDGYGGSVSVFDRDLSDWRNDYYSQIGVSFELPSHYQKLTAMENLGLFASLYPGATRDPLELLSMVGLEQDADNRVSRYSKGMQMRLNFARSLMHSPELLFLDEPTIGVDPVNARNIKDIILDQKIAGSTVFLTTHDMTVADQLCDRVAFIVDGRITTVDSPRNLKLQHGEQTVRVEYRDDGQLARQDFPLDGLGGSDAFGSFMSGQPEIETIHTQEATLEEIFIRVTGRELA